MNKYLPSKKFILIILSLILALGIIYLFSWLGGNKTNKKNDVLTQEQKAKVQEFIALDSDNDGLKDWEEALWKTDPKKADTDSDGTNDNDEISLNRDPLKTNTAPKDQTPTDKIDEAVIAAQKKAESDYKSLSATDRLSHELFSRYIATRKLGQNLTEAEKTAIINDFINNMPTIDYHDYTVDKLLTNQGSDTLAIKIYGEQVSEIILKNIAIQAPDVFSVVASYSSSEEAIAPIAALNQLDILINKNKASLDSLLKISVPVPAINVHLQLVNAFNKTYQDLMMIKNASKDIITTFVSLNQYSTNNQKLSDALVSLTQFIFSKQYQVQYSPADYGYKLFYAIIFKQ